MECTRSVWGEERGGRMISKDPRGQNHFCIRVPLVFQKFTSCHLAFTKDHHQFSATKRNPKKISFLWGKAKSEHSDQGSFGSRSCRAPRMAPPTFFPEPHSASQRRATTALNCVCEHLCFVSIDSVHLLAKMGPNLTASIP